VMETRATTSTKQLLLSFYWNRHVPASCVILPMKVLVLAYEFDEEGGW